MLHRLFCWSAVLLLLSLRVPVAATNRSNLVDRALENYWTSRDATVQAPASASLSARHICLDLSGIHTRAASRMKPQNRQNITEEE
jgi:hypothetical protein